MILAFVALLVLVALSIDALCLPTLLCAVAAMHWTASLHLADPLAPLYAFMAASLLSRTLLALLLSTLRHYLGGRLSA